MSDLEGDFQQLVATINSHLGRKGLKLEVLPYRSQPRRKFSLKAPKAFAWASLKPRLNLLAIGTKQEWAEKAGIGDYEYERNTQWNGPGAHWRVHAGDMNKLQKVANYLVQVCEARHS